MLEIFFIFLIGFTSESSESVDSSSFLLLVEALLVEAFTGDSVLMTDNLAFVCWEEVVVCGFVTLDFRPVGGGFVSVDLMGVCFTVGWVVG